MMSIVHNMVMMNAERQFGVISGKKAKNTEKLSSGYKINRAADDAAGLSISETMRRQIRGLKRGSKNIQDGISLLQTADGALAEVTDMLQRINELSVQAYNDTNTKQDREYIQAEVEQLLEEIERTGETTTFNGINILKWHSTVEETVKITDDQVVTCPLYATNPHKDLPQWLSQNVDDSLAVHSAYNNLAQYLDGIMVTQEMDSSGNVVRDANGNIQYVYYGKYQGKPGEENEYNYGSFNARWAGVEWTPKLNDNATVKISFEGLTQYRSTEDLYVALADLLGSGIGIPCRTCASQLYGVAFTGEIEGMSVSSMYPYYDCLEEDSFNGTIITKQVQRYVPEVNLNQVKIEDINGNRVDCFEAITNLAAQLEADPALDEAQLVEELAKKTAAALRDAAYSQMMNDPNMEDHFTKACVSGGNGYDIIVYDWRDEQNLQSNTASNQNVQKWMGAKYRFEKDVVVPGLEGVIEMDNPLWIVCSSQANDDIPIMLPYVSLDELGIEEYDVARYRQTFRYSDGYKTKLQAWLDSAYEETVQVTNTYTKCDIVDVDFQTQVINGEVKTMATPIYGEPQTVTRTSSYTRTVYALPYPVPDADDRELIEEYYDPSDNRLIIGALDKVMRWRSELGVTQNRLEHTYNNNQNKEENLSAAESRIRDADIATEMVSFASLSILQQAGQAVLAHGQQDKQYILELLK